MRIRFEQPGDIPHIYDVIHAAFQSDAEADLVNRIRSDGDAVYSLVAEEGQVIDGHILFSRIRAPFKALGMAPVAVRPERQNNGIGTILIKQSIQMAENDGWEGIFVLGEPEFYTRFGFCAGKAKNFISPYSGPHFMMLPLNGGPKIQVAEIHYPEAFTSLG